MSRPLLSIPLLSLALALGAPAPARAQDARAQDGASDRAPDRARTLVLRGRLHLGDGSPPLGDGMVVIEGGRVAGVGPYDDAAVPAGARVVTAPGAELTPGLIDAASTVGVTTPDWAEHGDEVVPHLRVLDALDLRDPGFARLARRGITAVFVSASPGSVIGGRGALLKTAGSARVVDPAAAIKANFGPEAWRRGARNRRPRGQVGFTTRRPTTRMGAVWVFRAALADAASGALEGPSGDVLRSVLAGDVSLRVQARTRGDIETALRLAAEAGVSIVLEEAIEARYLVDALAARRTRVIFGPLFDEASGYRGRFGGGDDPGLHTPRLLAARGVPFCLTARDQQGEGDLWGQALLAVRYGLAPERALAAVTGDAAQVLGGVAAQRLGLLSEGRDADVVLWSGPPLQATSRPLAVLIGGELVAGQLPAAEVAVPSRLAPGPGEDF